MITGGTGSIGTILESFWYTLVKEIHVFSCDEKAGLYASLI